MSTSENRVTPDLLVFRGVNRDTLDGKWVDRVIKSTEQGGDEGGWKIVMQNRMEVDAVIIDIDEDDEEVEDRRRRRKMRRKRNSMEQPSMLTAPTHVHGNEWKDMLALVDIHSTSTPAPPTNRKESLATLKHSSWIDQHLKKRECSVFVPSQKYLNKCGCGRGVDEHDRRASLTGTSIASSRVGTEESPTPSTTGERHRGMAGQLESPYDGVNRPRWAIRKHTVQLPTDAYGTITFEGGGHPSEARYARVSFDTPPEVLLRLLNGVWRIKPPKLIITIHGGLANFELQPRVARSLRRGIMKAAQSTDAWIITTGIHEGAVKHFCDALHDLKGNRKNKAKVKAIGIAPWGLLKKRNRLIGENVNVKYSMNSFSSGRLVELDDSHSHFLLADNGTVGRFGAEIVLRRRLENLLATGTAPVVCVVVEGGSFSVKVVHDYVTTPPLIPVVICDGSGRASDLIAFTHQYLQAQSHIPEQVRSKLNQLVKDVFEVDEGQARRILRYIIESAEKKKLMTIFRLGEGMDDVDQAIFTALLKDKNRTPLEQLRLALAWNRVDIARTQLFGGTIEWSPSALHEALMEALLHDRDDFVNLLLEKGVSVHNFLTFERLEKLYNTIGQVVERLIGRAFQSCYRTEEFLARYSLYLSQPQNSSVKRSVTMRRTADTPPNGVTRKKTVKAVVGGLFRQGNELEEEEDDDRDDEEIISERTLFTLEYPFNDLLVWAVLTKRQEMARTMWRHGREGLAKALVASRLNMSLAEAAAEDYLELQLCEDLRNNAEEFRVLATELLDELYKMDDECTQSLLTCEMENWGGLNCLTLASLLHDRDFMKHPCPQLILTELWHGGMKVRKHSNWLVLAGIFFPPYIFSLDFKSKEQLRRMAQTALEHDQAIESSSDSSLSSDSSFSDSSSSESEEGVLNSIVSTARRSMRRSFDKKKDKKDDKKEEPKEPQAIHHLAAHMLPGIFMNHKNGKITQFTTQLSTATSPPASPVTSLPVPIANGVTRSRANTVQRKLSRKRKESETVRRRSRSSTKATGGKMSLDYHDYDEDLDEINGTATPLNWRKRLKEFYTAPITTFWLWGLMFGLFQTVLIIVLLLRTNPTLRISEYFLVAYVIVFGCDIVRRFIFYEVHPMRIKIRKFFGFRNTTSIIAVTTYLIGFFFRCLPHTMMIGRVLLIMNSVFWSFRLVDYLSVHERIGPFITTASEMVPRTMTILVMLSVVLLSFGTVRQSITYPYEVEWDWLLIRNIFLKPYYMLYGEVYAAEIDICDDDIWDAHIETGIPIRQLNVSMYDEACVPGYWVAPLYMVFFMLIANVLLMNTMVACCTYVYENRIEYVREIFLFERFRQVMLYDSMPCLPPPFTIFYHIYLLFKYWQTRDTEHSRRKLMDNSLKTFLSTERLQTVRRFESEVLDDMCRKKEFANLHSQEALVAKTSVKSEQMLSNLQTMAACEETLRDMLRDLDERIGKIENRKREEVDFIKRMASQMELLTKHLGLSTTPSSPSTPPAAPKTKRHIPKLLLRLPTEDLGDGPDLLTITGNEEEGQENIERSRSNSSSGRHRHHHEYTTIADGIQGPLTRHNIRPSISRRSRFDSSDVNALLFSVSEEGDEQHSDCGHSDVQSDNE